MYEKDLEREDSKDNNGGRVSHHKRVMHSQDLYGTSRKKQSPESLRKRHSMKN